MLTKRQADCHVFIARWMETHHEAPSYEEIIAGLNLRSKSEVHRLLVALEERGFIRRLKNRARAIELLRQPGAPALPTTDEAVQAVIDAARAVLEEADHKHDTMAPPCKYIAPYGSLAKLRAALAGLETAG